MMLQCARGCDSELPMTIDELEELRAARDAKINAAWKDVEADLKALRDARDAKIREVWRAFEAVLVALTDASHDAR